MENWNAANNELSAAVLASGRLDELLAELGCEVKGYPGGDRFRGRCPVHKGADTNFVVGTDGEKFPVYWACHSHRCHKAAKLKGNLLGLVRGALTGDPDRPATMAKAVAFVEDFLAREGDRPTAVRQPAERPTRPTLSLTRAEVRRRLLLPSPYFLSRGFSPAVLDRYDIGESRRYGWAVAPVYDDRGHACVGAVYRSTKPPCGTCSKCHHPADSCARGEPRWWFPQGFPKGDYLFNYAAAVRSVSPFVLLVEGVTDVLRAAEAGVVAVAGFGTDLSVPQALKLAVLNKPVVVAFDNDPAGTRAAASIVTLLRREGVSATVRHPPSGYKDVGEIPAAEVTRWLAA
ncbi:toprim domain-containing protein [Urbifossiella limnaea]|uniref:DNA primase n=1 Tax=Urbifossiella limnaea TaxID=2528023 RepID=A0A517XSU1_9BACT|nr:toprim domain-containing protein [Urbifossiella limnaea]QDU20596.1 DNA primase [Urbifossiella limnaea]